MHNLELRKAVAGPRGMVIVLSVLVVYIGITMTGSTEVLAQDKSTSITCTGAGPCEKTECVNGDCETIATNSSNISSTNGLDKKNSDSEESIADSLRERLNAREN
jgi:hypothetical protein